MYSTRVLKVAVMSASLFLLGCGAGGPPREGMPKLPTVPVSGVVRYNGQGVANATVTLQSLDGKITSRGKTDSAGNLAALSTYGSEDGTPPGRYKAMVAVSGTREIEPGVLAPEPPGGFKSPIPTRYASLTTTNLVVDIQESGTSDLRLELK